MKLTLVFRMKETKLVQRLFRLKVKASKGGLYEAYLTSKRCLSRKVC